MRPFRRRFGRYTATFEEAESFLLADLVDQVRRMLAARRISAPADPLVELTGIRSGPSSAPDDPALARLLPDFHAEDAALSAGLRVLREPMIIDAKDAAAATVLETLPRGGGMVRLDEEVATAWISALNDVRLALGVRLAITQDEEVPPAAAEDPDGPVGAMFATYRWLSAVQDSLVTAMLD